MLVEKNEKTLSFPPSFFMHFWIDS